MRNASRTPRPETARGIEGLLESEGFRATRSGYRRGGVTAAVATDWCVFTARAPRGADILCGQLGRAGLWKPMSGRRVPSWTCHLPLSALPREDDEGVGESRALIAWITDTLQGMPPRGWSPPPREEVLSSLSAPRLTVRSGPLAVQGDLVCGPDRLALRFPLVHRLAPSLPAARRAWLREVLAGAQDRWRLARIGWDEEAAREPQEASRGPEIAVEADLSGAPRESLELLFPGAIDALRCAVARVLWPVSLLADPGIECTSWNSSWNSTSTPERASPAERS